MGVSFSEAWAELYRAEGNKNDETEAFGIERRWHGVDFEQWPPNEAAAYSWYRDRVWTGIGIHLLPDSVRIDAFLFALNTSLVRGQERNAPISSPKLARALQAALNALGHPVKIDGQLGPKTIRAAHRTAHGEKLVVAFRAACVMYYSGLAEFERYERSWLRRMEAV